MKAERGPQYLYWRFNCDGDWYAAEEENAGVGCVAVVDPNDDDLIHVEEAGSSATSIVPVDELDAPSVEESNYEEGGDDDDDDGHGWGDDDEMDEDKNVYAM